MPANNYGAPFVSELWKKTSFVNLWDYNILPGIILYLWEYNILPGIIIYYSYLGFIILPGIVIYSPGIITYSLGL